MARSFWFGTYQLSHLLGQLWVLFAQHSPSPLHNRDRISPFAISIGAWFRSSEFRHLVVRAVPRARLYLEAPKIPSWFHKVFPIKFSLLSHNFPIFLFTELSKFSSFFANLFTFFFSWAFHISRMFLIGTLKHFSRLFHLQIQLKTTTFAHTSWRRSRSKNSRASSFLAYIEDEADHRLIYVARASRAKRRFSTRQCLLRLSISQQVYSPAM